MHALRLIGSGLFDRHKRLAIVLGHLGEGLAFSLWRIDNRNVWMNAPHKYAAEKPVERLFPQPISTSRRRGISARRRC